MSNVFQNLQLQRIANAIEDGTVTGSITIDVTGAGDMQPATATAAGSHGLVPAPQAGDENKVLSGAGTWIDAGGGELEDLEDVTITSPTSGESLKYDGSKWVNGNVTADLPDFIEETSGSIVTVEAAERPAKSLKVAIEPVQSGSGDPSPDNIRPIIGWTECNVVVSPTQDAEDGTTYTIEFKDGNNPLTVYGGTLDATTGMLTVTNVSVDMGSLNWGNAGMSSLAPKGHHAYVCNGFGAKYPGNDYTPPNLICSQYVAVTRDDTYRGTAEGFAINAHGDLYAYIAEYSAGTASAFKTAMNGVQLVYELATPVTYQLTPTVVQMLLGTNNLWADTGEITELKYITQTYNDLLAEMTGGGVSYSTAEQYTGLKWIDGSKIYQITKVYENVAQTSDSNPLTLDTLSDVDTMVRYDVRATTTGGGVINDNFYLDNSYKFHTIYYPDRKSLQYRANWGDSGYFTITITYQYTKRG